MSLLCVCDVYMSHVMHMGGGGGQDVYILVATHDIYRSYLAFKIC